MGEWARACPNRRVVDKLLEVEDNSGPPPWFRGPRNSSRHRIGVAIDLKRMRGREGVRLTQKDMARELSRELGRHIPESSVARWENGFKMAGGDVYRAYIYLTAASRPTDVGGVDERLMPRQELDSLKLRVTLMERAMQLASPSLDLVKEELWTVAEAAREVHVSRQTIHNWIKAQKVRYTTQGRRLLVSAADVTAMAQGRPTIIEAKTEELIRWAATQG